MSNPEILERYIAMARAAGTDVECVSETELPVRLAAALPASGGNIAALSASGWPRGLRERVVARLASSGFEVTAPRKEEGGGYSWDIDRLAAAPVGIVWCEHYLADTGSLVLVSGPGMGGLATLLPEISLVLSPAQGCLGDLADYLQKTGGSPPSRITLATGPSRTGDIEATMTKGVHGPGKVVHFIIGA
ncbi:MAG: lactate utilization protein [Syntrophobacteraceae bacterium]|nr:lactate utilization protein [Syntrophobacteraceae bacterium]